MIFKKIKAKKCRSQHCITYMYMYRTLSFITTTPTSSTSIYTASSKGSFILYYTTEQDNKYPLCRVNAESTVYPFPRTEQTRKLTNTTYTRI